MSVCEACPSARNLATALRLDPPPPQKKKRPAHVDLNAIEPFDRRSNRAQAPAGTKPCPIPLWREFALQALHNVPDATHCV